MFLGNNMYVMVQTLKGGDGPYLLHSLSVINTYTEMTTRSNWVAVMCWKAWLPLQSLSPRASKLTQVVAVKVVFQVEVVPGTLEKLDEMQGIIQQTRMLVELRREVLFQQLELSGLEWWSDRNQAATHALLAA